MTFREDESPLRRGRAAGNFAILRRLALNLLKRETSKRPSVAAQAGMIPTAKGCCSVRSYNALALPFRARNASSSLRSSPRQATVTSPLISLMMLWTTLALQRPGKRGSRPSGKWTSRATMTALHLDCCHHKGVIKDRKPIRARESEVAFLAFSPSLPFNISVLKLISQHFQQGR